MAEEERDTTPETPQDTALEVFTFREGVIAPRSAVGKALGFVLRRKEQLHEELGDLEALEQIVLQVLGDYDETLEFLDTTLTTLQGSLRTFKKRVKSRREQLRKMVE